MAKLTAPIPREKIGESFVWREWFQRLSDKVFGTMAAQDATSVDISGGVINNIDFSSGDYTWPTFNQDTTGTAGSVAHSVTFNNSGTGAASGTDFDGSATRTISYNTIGAQGSSAPVTKTADFTLADTETWVINNKSGSTCTVTLPAASSWSGRVVHFQNYQAKTLVSASSNVVPLVGGSAGTAILAAVAGDTATLVSDGSNWLMTQYVPNNVLLLE